jgi:hypothetical protein
MLFVPSHPPANFAVIVLLNYTSFGASSASVYSSVKTELSIKKGTHVSVGLTLSENALVVTYIEEFLMTFIAVYDITLSKTIGLYYPNSIIVSGRPNFPK